MSIRNTLRCKRHYLIIRIIDISNRSDLCFRDLAKLPLGTKQGAASASRTCARVVEAVGECHDHSWHKK